MLLRERLKEYTKKELLEQARLFELKKYSRLRKDALIDSILECFCTKEMLKSRLTCLTKEQMTLFRKACNTPQEISINQVMDSMQLSRYWLGFFEEPTDRFYVFEEVAKMFSEIDDEAFRKEQEKKGWMMKCVQFFINFYGIAPIEVIYELYKLKVKDTIDEMIDMLLGMPIDIVESCIVPMVTLGLQDWPKDDPIYTSKGLFVNVPMFEDEELDYLLDQQMDIEFYIPSVQQIEEIYSMGYEASSLAYKRLERFFRRKMNMPYEHAVSWCLKVWVNSYEGEAPMDVINLMLALGVEFKSEKLIDEFIGLLMDAYNNTRLKENRGYKPNELVEREFADGLPTVVPGSSHAATLLRDAALYPNGIDGNPVRVEKKIYPNDLCPCGSGKKYKKCCGRN